MRLKFRANCDANFDNNYFWATTGPLFSPNFSLANVRCSEIQVAKMMASVPPQKNVALTCLRIFIPPRENPGIPMDSHTRAGGPSHFCEVTTLLRLRLRRHHHGRSGLPNSSRLPPVHIWWLSQATRSRAMTTRLCQLPTIANCNRNVTVQTVRFAFLGT